MSFKFEEKEKPEVIKALEVERYKGYSISHHEIFDYAVCQVSPYSLKARRLKTLEDAREFIDTLPPAPSSLGWGRRRTV